MSLTMKKRTKCHLNTEDKKRFNRIKERFESIKSKLVYAWKCGRTSGYALICLKKLI